MRIVGLVLLIAAVSCRPAYRPAGAPPPLEVAGIYRMSEKMYSSGCSPKVARAQGIEARSKKIRVEVSHSAPSALLVMRIDVLPYDGQVLPNGSFELRPISSASTRAGSSYKQAASGRFTSTGFTARYTVETTDGASQQPCKYVLLWEADKL